MSLKDKIRDVYLDDQASSDYLIYGTSTIEDRAIVGTCDGVKPVIRRVMYAMHKLGLHHKANTQKAALIVGDTMGKYHPHGDSSIFQAAVAASQLPQPLIDGSDSNWGTMTSGSGAMRYINGRLSKYADLVFFDHFYQPMLQYGPNYDSTRREPVNLITLLPNGLLNGNFGICPGVNTRTPAFTLPSMVKVLKAAVANKGKCGVDECKGLEWTTDYGGVLAKSSHNKAELKQFFKTGIGSFDWESSFVLDEKANSIRFNAFAPFSTNDKASAGGKSPLEKLLTSVEEVKGVQSIDDDSDEKDKYRQAYIVRFVKTLRGEKRDRAIKQVAKLFTSRQRYDVKVTDRTFDVEADAVIAKLRPVTVPELITEWIAYRIDLEKRACTYWIKELETEIRWNEVLRLAIAKLDLLFKLVKSDLNDKDLVAAIAKNLKVTETEADTILKRNLRQLRRMEDKQLEAKIKELETRRKELKGRLEKPADYLLTDLTRIAKELA